MNKFKVKRVKVAGSEIVNNPSLVNKLSFRMAKEHYIINFGVTNVFLSVN